MEESKDNTASDCSPCSCESVGRIGWIRSKIIFISANVSESSEEGGAEMMETSVSFCDSVFPLSSPGLRRPKVRLVLLVRLWVERGQGEGEGVGGKRKTEKGKENKREIRGGKKRKREKKENKWEKED